MTSNARAIARLAVTTALAAGLLGACSMNGSSARPNMYAAQAEAALGKGKLDKGVTLAEQAVLAAPRDPALRALLGSAYLKAGRFASAAATYDDALALGDESVATVLGLALAEIAAGNNDAAIELLDDWRDVVPASDRGLALALAGQPERGVAVLGDALRGGDASPKARQNLAYALALNGNWQEARLMMAQDIPADQIDERIGQWARIGQPDNAMGRVAQLLGVQPRADVGQPQALALINFPSPEQLAAEAQAQTLEVQEVTAPVELAIAETPGPVVELSPPAEMTADAAPEQGILFASLAQPGLAVASDAPFISAPVIQPIAAPPALAIRPDHSVMPRIVGSYVDHGAPVAKPAKRKAAAVKSVAAKARAPKVVAGGTHWVQLGSYTDPAVAGEGWDKFVARAPALKPYRMTTTTAIVEGTKHWRVSAAGFASYDDAARMCRMVKQRGGACLVVTAPNGLAGRAGSGRQLARR